VWFVWKGFCGGEFDVRGFFFRWEAFEKDRETSAGSKEEK